MSETVTAIKQRKTALDFSKRNETSKRRNETTTEIESTASAFFQKTHRSILNEFRNNHNWHSLIQLEIS